MITWLSILSCLILIGIALFDFKDRSIPTLLIIIEGVAAGFVFYLLNINDYLLIVMLNLTILITQLGILFIWLKFRKKDNNFFLDAIGWGDIWMLAIATLFFSPIYYVGFIIVVSFVSLIYGLIIKFILNTDEKYSLIPLAGIMAAGLFIVQCFNVGGKHFFDLNYVF